MTLINCLLFLYNIVLMTQMINFPRNISQLPTAFPNTFKQRVKTARAPALWMNDPKIISAKNSLKRLRSISSKGDKNLSDSCPKFRISKQSRKLKQPLQTKHLVLKIQEAIANCSSVSSIKSMHLQSCIRTLHSVKYERIRTLRKKCPNTEFFLVRIFLYSDWIRRFTE